MQLKVVSLLCYRSFYNTYPNIQGPNLSDADHVVSLAKHVEELVQMNKELKDRNEELEINMLSIPFDDRWKAPSFFKK